MYVIKVCITKSNWSIHKKKINISLGTSIVDIACVGKSKVGEANLGANLLPLTLGIKLDLIG